MSACVPVVSTRTVGSHRGDGTPGEQGHERHRERNLAFESTTHDPHVAKGA
jgi:hypothetical protein